MSRPQSLGLTRVKIVFRHIIPNILSPIIVLVGMDMATMIIYEAGLSFLGLGSNHYSLMGYYAARWIQIHLNFALMILWPSVTIAISMIAFPFQRRSASCHGSKRRERKQ